MMRGMGSTIARPRGHPAFTMLELALVLAIVGTLAAVAVSSFHGYRERAQLAQVIVDLKSISTEVDGYRASNGDYPASLTDVGAANMNDIWGNPYRYLRLSDAKPGKARRDRFLVPINSDYDLYSMGPDGRTTSPLTSATGRDDVIRANDGSFYGPAQQY
jgi:general secretion pathway protein G